jgi:menaquinone-dependent protoporphyrinogen oxidase
MRILIVFASSYGQTAAIAKAIAERLRELGHVADLADAGAHAPSPPQGYDAVVIGSRVQIAKHHPAIHRYIERYRAAFTSLPTYFFSVSMSAAGKPAGSDPNGYLEKLFTATSWHPGRAVAFGGSLPYRRYNWFLRLIMRAMSKQGGHSTDTSKNHEYTDWNAVRAFADTIDGDVSRRSVGRSSSAGTSAASGRSPNGRSAG